MLWLAVLACSPDDEAPPLGPDALVLLAYAGEEVVVGADVAVTTPAGDVQEGTTDENGKFFATDLDLEAGGISVAMVHTRFAVTLSDVDAEWVAANAGDRGYIGLGFPADDDVDTVDLSVEYDNIPDGDQIIGIVHPVGYLAGPSPVLAVPSDVGLDVVAMAWHRDLDTPHSPWGYANIVDSIAVAAVDPLAQDALARVDLSDDQQVPFATTIEVPDEPFFDESAGYVTPVAVDTNASVQYGMPSFVDKDGTTVQFEGSYAALDSVFSPVQMWRFDAQDGRYSVVFAPGWPEDGAAPWTVLVPPEPTPPWKAGAPMPIDLPREDDDPALDGYAILVDAAGNPVWSHRWSPESGEVALPELPTGHTAAEILGDGAQGYAWVWAPDPEDDGVQRYAGTAVLDVVP